MENDIEKVNRQIEDAILACMHTEEDLLDKCLLALKSLHVNGVSKILIPRYLHIAEKKVFRDEQTEKLYISALKSLIEFCR